MSSREIFDASAILACSLMGVMVSVDRHRRFGAAMAVGVVASVAGGSLRDFFLGATPVFWVRQPWQIYLAFSATAALFLALRKLRIRERMLLVPDALSVAIPAAIGAKAALAAGDGCGTAGVIGLIAGMMGGILRDLLCEREPAVLKRELYGSAALVGAAAVCVLERNGASTFCQLLGGSIAGTGARIAAVCYHISFGRLLLQEKVGTPGR
jgi:uncharacterized membrane protein YeiH